MVLWLVELACEARAAWTTKRPIAALLLGVVKNVVDAGHAWYWVQSGTGAAALAHALLALRLVLWCHRCRRRGRAAQICKTLGAVRGGAVGDLHIG